MEKVIYVITKIGSEELELPINTIVRLHPKIHINNRHWERSKIFDIVEEKIDALDDDKTIKRNTRWIAKETDAPTVKTIFGGYINQGCHILPSYSQHFLNQLIHKNEK